MAKSTRAAARYDRWLQDTGVNITPPTHRATATPTFPTA